jgi:hypothetical protein
MKDYPEPPWTMSGESWMCPAFVRTEELEIPPRFSAVSLAGRSAGVFAYVRYLPPSPIVYDELIWMPTMLRDRTGPTGYHVAVMYVDDETTLRGGRELWWLPKTLASFTRTEVGVTVDAEDGTHLELELSEHGPSFPVPTNVATLQEKDGRALRFRGTGKGEGKVATVRVRSFRTDHPSWAGFDTSKKSPLAVHVRRFETVMHAPRELGEGR